MKRFLGSLFSAQNGLSPMSSEQSGQRQRILAEHASAVEAINTAVGGSSPEALSEAISRIINGGTGRSV